MGVDTCGDSTGAGGIIPVTFASETGWRDQENAPAQGGGEGELFGASITPRRANSGADAPTGEDGEEIIDTDCPVSIVI